MLNDSLMVAIVLTLVFGSVIFYLYNRLSMTERKMGLFEGVLTDLKIMMDSAPFAYGPSPPNMREFEDNSEMSPEYLNAISGPVPLQSDDVEDVVEDYQQTLEEALERATAVDSASSGNSGNTGPYRTLQIDEPVSSNVTGVAISVTKLSPDLDSMTVKELNSLAKQRGLSVPAGTRRKDLIEMLKKTQAQTQVQEEFEGAMPTMVGESLDGKPLEVTL